MTGSIYEVQITYVEKVQSGNHKKKVIKVAAPDKGAARAKAVHEFTGGQIIKVTIL